MENRQPGILAPVPRFGRYLSFSLKAGADPRKSLGELAKIVDGKNAVIGIGESTTMRGAQLDLRALGF